MKYQSSCYGTYSRIREIERVEKKAQKVKGVLSSVCENPHNALCLEIGCAYGAMTKILGDLFPNIIGIEYDQIALQHIPLDNKRKTLFAQADGLFLPFPNNSLDVVVCTQVYEHVPDADQLFREMYRVLRKGGIVFFSGPNKLFPIEPHYFLPFLHWLPKICADHYIRFFKKGDSYYEKIFSPTKLRFLLKGFEIQDKTYEIFLNDIKERAPLMWAILKEPPVIIKNLLANLSPNLNWVLYKVDE